MASWIAIAKNSDFSLQNLPYGVFSTTSAEPRIGIAIGDEVLDLKALVAEHVFDDLDFDVATLERATLNAYAALDREIHSRVRRRLQDILQVDTQLANVLKDNQQRREKCLVPMKDVTMHLPMTVGDYTDFFIGIHHATNCAGFLKPGSDIVQMIPSFWEMPVAYHGRSSSVTISGTPVTRPKGQYRGPDGVSVAGVCQQLDFEVEFAAFIGKGSELGQPINVNEAEKHIFGFVLLNDWSARDFQKNEFGPFTSKNFNTQISPWIVPFEALNPFRVPPVKGDRHLPEYLTQEEANSAYDIPIRVTLTDDSQRYHVAECNTKFVTFSFAQMIAHHTRGGCPLRPGDLIATGTMSGPTRAEEGCFLEQSRYGTDPYEMVADGPSGDKISRTFLEDGDVIEFTSNVCSQDGLGNIGFGTCRGKVLATN